jgi:16S rRNA (guanine527-N7)-methyltransferase
MKPIVKWVGGKSQLLDTIKKKLPKKFNKYYELLIQWNEKINLTRITEPEEVAVKHFADSLTLLNYYDIPQGAKVIDVAQVQVFPAYL